MAVKKLTIIFIGCFLLILPAVANAQTPTPTITMTPLPTPTPTVTPTPTPLPLHTSIEWNRDDGTSEPAMEGVWYESGTFTDPANHNFTFYESGNGEQYCVRFEVETTYHFYPSALGNLVQMNANHTSPADGIINVDWDIVTTGDASDAMSGAGHVGDWSINPHDSNRELLGTANGWAEVTIQQGIATGREFSFSIVHNDGTGGDDPLWEQHHTRARWLDCNPVPDICEDGEMIIIDYPFNEAGSIWEDDGGVSPIWDTLKGVDNEVGLLFGANISHTHVITQGTIEAEFSASPDGLLSDGWLTWHMSRTQAYTSFTVTVMYASGYSETIPFHEDDPIIYTVPSWYSMTHHFPIGDRITQLDVVGRGYADDIQFAQCRIEEAEPDEPDDPPFIDNPFPAPTCRECLRPANPLSIGGWLSWLWCQLLNLFTCYLYIWFLNVMNVLLAVLNTFIAFAFWLGRQLGLTTAWAIGWLQWLVDVVKRAIVYSLNAQLSALNAILEWIAPIVNAVLTTWEYAGILWRLLIDTIAWVAETIGTMFTLLGRVLSIFGDDSTGTLPFCIDDGTGAGLWDAGLNGLKICTAGVWALMYMDSWFASTYMMAIVWQIVAVCVATIGYWVVLQIMQGVDLS